MNLTLSKETVIYNFSKSNKPVLTISTGDIVTIETIDAFGNQLKTEDDRLDALDWEHVNPATGPIYVTEAVAGDMLKISIKDIVVDSTGVMASIPQAGVFGKSYSESHVKIFEIKDNMTCFNDFKLEITPMIGVIGVAPLSQPISCGEPGHHGGNMDNKMIKKGSVLFLPVFHDGALFALGDLHALMGDGEVNATGIEIGGKVTVQFEVIKNMSITDPLLISDNQFYTIYSADTLDESVEGSTKAMHRLVMQYLELSHHEAAMFLSLLGNTEICQIVDPKITSRFKIPYKYFSDYF